MEFLEVKVKFEFGLRLLANYPIKSPLTLVPEGEYKGVCKGDGQEHILGTAQMCQACSKACIDEASLSSMTDNALISLLQKLYLKFVPPQDVVQENIHY